MEKYINAEEFMNYLRDNGLVIIPESYADERYKELQAERLRRKVLRKSLITFKEISDARIWGDVSAKAAKSYALREIEKENGLINADEVRQFPKGKIRVYKIHRPAVERIAKHRGLWIK